MISYLEALLTRLWVYAAESQEHQIRSEHKDYMMKGNEDEWCWWHSYHRQFPQNPFDFWRFAAFLRRKGFLVGPEGATFSAYRVSLRRSSDV